MIPTVSAPPGPEVCTRGVHLLAIAVATGVAYWPTLHNQFLPLGFDDGLILDTTAIHQLAWVNLQSLFTEFQHAHYVPLTMLSFAVDYQLWGLEPFGYHLTNIVLQVLAAMLAYLFLTPLLGSSRLAVLAALIFAVHPLQMEAVSLAVQRKTVLSGMLFLLTLVLYQQWRAGGLHRYYLGALVAFLGAALAKPAVVTLPCILLLYDYVAWGGRMRLRDKLPFFAVAGLIALAAVRAHAAVGALHPPHGGTWLAHTLMMSRVLLEYVDALFLPFNLAPIYYYPHQLVYSPINVLALAVIVVSALAVTARRHRNPWTFFCFWWFMLALLPESNLVPLAQLRADRFVYLAVLPFAVWVVVGIDHFDRIATPQRRLATSILGPTVVGFLVVMCYGSAAVWRDDVSAWQRVVARHPWCATAYAMLGRAHYERGDLQHAEPLLREAVRLSDRVPEAQLYLAKVYAEGGRRDLARTTVERFLELAPSDTEGLQLLAGLAASPDRQPSALGLQHSTVP